MAQDTKKANLFKNRVKVDILCQLPSTSPKNPSNSANLQDAPNRSSKYLCQPGLSVAEPPATPMARTTLCDTTSVDLISNAGVLDIPAHKDIPNEYEFEILRLRRRVEELECVVRDRDERVVTAIGMIEDELQMYRTYLHDHVGETFSGIKRRVVRLEAALLRLREKGSKFYPPLDVPSAWQKK